MPCTHNQVHHVFHSRAILHVREKSGTAFPHPPRIALHYLQVCTHRRGEINFIDHQQVTARYTGPAFTRNLIAAGDVDDIHDEISELARVIGGKVIAAGLDQEDVGLEVGLQRFQGKEVDGDVLAHRGVRTAASFNRANTRWGKSFVPSEEFGVLSKLPVGKEG